MAKVFSQKDTITFNFTSDDGTLFSYSFDMIFRYKRPSCTYYSLFDDDMGYSINYVSKYDSILCMIYLKHPCGQLWHYFADPINDNAFNVNIRKDDLYLFRQCKKIFDHYNKKYKI